jgi:hypothetical protein
MHYARLAVVSTSNFSHISISSLLSVSGGAEEERRTFTIFALQRIHRTTSLKVPLLPKALLLLLISFDCGSLDSDLCL